jgi:hypothetical protein
MTKLLNKLDEFVKKYDDLKKSNRMDLSSDQDLTLAIMNLVGIEEHLFFSGAKTTNTKYYDLITEVRNIRKELLKKIIKEYEGEVWCISKHLLAASYRLMEVGAKQLDKNNKTEAYQLFENAYNLYSLFWALNMNIIDASGIKKIDENALNKNDNEKNGFMGKMGKLVKKVINCCLE